MNILDRMKAAAGLPVVIPRAGEVKEPGWIGSLSWPYERERGKRRPFDFLTDETYYTIHTWVYQAVFTLSTKIAEVPLALFKSTGPTEDEVEEITKHAALDLLDKPNTYQPAFDFFEAIDTHLELSGNAYVQKVRTRPGGPPEELWPIRSDRVTVVPGVNRLVDGYIVRVGNDYFPVLPEDMIHFKYFSPINDHYGIGPLQAVKLGLVTDLYAGEYTKNFFLNSGRPDGLISSDQPLSDADAEVIRLRWQQLHGGLERSHQIAVLGKGSKFQQLGLTQKDMDFPMLRKMNREEILAVFGVPPVMVGLLEYASYANAREQEKVFYQVSVIPRLIKLQQILTQALLSEWEDSSYYFSFDLSGIEALKEDLAAKSELGERLIRSGQWTPNEVRQEIWTRDPIDQGGDLIYLPGGLLPIGQLKGTSKTARGARRKLLRSTIKQKLTEIHQMRAVALLEAPKAKDRKEEVDIEKERRDGIWKRFERNINPLTQDYEKRMKKWFKEQKDRYVDRILALEPKARKDPQPIFTPRNIFPDEDDELRRLANVLGAIETRIINEAGKNTLLELGIKAQFNLLDPEVVRFLEEDKSKGLAKVLEKETRERIEGTLIEGMREGENIRDLAARVRAEFDNMSVVRSMRISRTETTVAYNFATHKTYQQQSDIVKKKEWISSRDADVRETHRIDGQPRGLNEKFSNGLMYPGENGAPPAEIINCRCTIAPIVKGRE